MEASRSSKNLEIFGAIAKLIASSEFQEATFQYMDQHKDVFTDDDENKLEYTPIFNNYINILESVIDAQLYAKYDQDSVGAFYMDFKDNFKEYEKEDAEAVETLFSFTDFNKFKTQMLQCKTGQIDYKREEASNPDYSQKGEEYYYKVIAEDLKDKNLNWRMKLDHHDKDLDMVIHQRPTEGDDHMVRVDITMRGISMATYRTFM